MSLLAKAKAYKHVGGKRSMVPATPDELELLRALQGGEIDRHQLAHALGLRPGLNQTHTWLTTRLNRAFRFEQMELDVK